MCEEEEEEGWRARVGRRVCCEVERGVDMVVMAMLLRR